MSFSPPTPPTSGSSPGVPPVPNPGANPAPPGPRSTPLPDVDAAALPIAAPVLGAPQGQTHPPVPAPGRRDAPPPPQRSRRFAGLVVAMLIIGPAVAISGGVWLLLRGREADERSDPSTDPNDATDDTAIDVTSPPSPAASDAAPTSGQPAATEPPASVPAPSLFDPAGATALVATFDAAIGGAPTKLMRVTIYPEYAFATAQDPANALHVDEYPYRDGVIGPSRPVTVVGDGDLEANLFAATDVDWSFLPRAVTEAPGLMLQVEEGAVTHIIVERSVFTADFSVVVRVYVTGPRGGGYAEYTPAGELVKVVV